MSLEVNQAHISEINSLVESGDESLAERRKTFATLKGRQTTLDDEQLKIAIAATDDDDDDLFVANVEKVESGDYVIAP